MAWTGLGWAWAVATALAGNPYEGRSADVTATLRIDTEPERVTRALADLPRVAGLFDETCLVRWRVGVPETGVGARARVTYTPHLMNRRLTLEVAEVEPGREVVWTHEHKHGFDTVWSVQGVPGGSVVTVTTPLHPPAWPLRRLYFEDIHPAWTGCYERALRALGAPLSDEAMAAAEAALAQEAERPVCVPADEATPTEPTTTPSSPVPTDG